MDNLRLLWKAILNQGAPARWIALLSVMLMSGAMVAANLDSYDPKDPQSVPMFAISKSLCVGDPASDPDAINCPLASVVPENTPVYYVFRITNPMGQPQQTVTLNDVPPSNFQPSGGLTCQLPSGANVAVIQGTNAGDLGTIDLPLDETVICFLAGQFTGSGSVKNTVDARNQFGFEISDEVNTSVQEATPLGTDLAITKKAGTPVLDISSGSVLSTYTITITNNGPGDADIGSFFTLHDKLGLLVNSVPFRAQLVSSQCTATAGSDCLSASGPQSAGNILVGTSGSTNLFSWGFDNGQGTILAGGSLTIEITVRYDKLAGLNCYLAAGADGVRNTAFFTLASGNDVFTEANPANNTAAADVKLTTGAGTQDGDCGRGHLKMSKEQYWPYSGTADWGSVVLYRIKIKNVSLPAQPITISADNFEDWVTEGINTPPFTRTDGSVSCTASTQAGLCALLNGNFSPFPDFVYSYYGQANMAWHNTAASSFTLNPGEEIEFAARFKYVKPDCETVPAAPQKPIINTAIVEYQATEYGALSTNAPLQTFRQQASAVTNMRDQKACQFKVTKKRVPDPSISDNYVHFGTPFTYQIEFESQEPDRAVGTVMDVLRLNRADYASAVPFTASWSCTDNGGVSDYAATGNLTGYVRHTSSPAQGSAAVDFRANASTPVFFKQGGKLSCTVTIELERPDPGDPFCLNEEARLENMAMMDVTHPLNTNIHWPPSGAYNAGSFTNPSPQNRNWAAASVRLPRCVDAQINKEASVPGLPSYSAAWTYPGGPMIDYSVKIDNLSTGQLRSYGNNWSPFNGVFAKDSFDAPYQAMSNLVTQQNCLPSGFCQQNNAAPRLLGVRDIANDGSGTWTYKWPASGTANLQAGTIAKNCVELIADGEMNPDNGYWYTKSGDNPLSEDCASIPILHTTRIGIRKEIDDQTGAGITQGGPFTIEVTCTPYALFGTSGTFTMNAGTTHIIQNVPVPSDCTVEETQLPPVPAAAIAQCQKSNPFATAEWGSPVIAPATLSKPLNANGNGVKITNVLRCVSGDTGTIHIKKLMRGWPKNFGPLQVTFNLSCTPPANPSSVTTTLVGNMATATTQAPVGAQCTITEATPTFPPAAYTYCNNIKPMGSMEPQWQSTIYQPGNTFTVKKGENPITAVNRWQCQPKKQPGTLIIEKLYTGDKTLMGHAMTLGVEVTATCTPAASQPVLSLNVPGGQTTGTISVSNGAICQITETLPPVPAAATQYCKSKAFGFRKAMTVAKWATPTISPNPAGPVPSGGQAIVRVENRLVCGIGRPTEIKGNIKNIPVGDVIQMGADLLKEAGDDTGDEPEEAREAEKDKPAAARREPR